MSTEDRVPLVREVEEHHNALLSTLGEDVAPGLVDAAICALPNRGRRRLLPVRNSKASCLERAFSVYWRQNGALLIRLPHGGEMTLRGGDP